MDTTNKTALVIAFAIAILLLLLFGGGMTTGAMFSGGMMGNGHMGSEYMGGISWMWIPTLLTLGVGALLGWAIFAKK